MQEPVAFCISDIKPGVRPWHSIFLNLYADLNDISELGWQQDFHCKNLVGGLPF